jgi:Na+/H+ antiporter NhaC
VFEGTAWSLFPPALAIVLAVVTRKVYLALGVGVVSGACLLKGGLLSGMLHSLSLVLETLSRPGNALILAFIFVIGSLLSSMESAGGIKGFVAWLERSGFVRSERRVKVLAWLVGVCFFVEGNMTILVGGALSRPLFDKWKISREKLAYLIDSTSGPVCLLIPFNAWGAYVIGILQTVEAETPVRLFLWSILYNFYSLFAVTLAFLVAFFSWDFGPMKAAEERTRSGKVLSDGAELMADASVFTPSSDAPRSSKWLLLGPLLATMSTMPLSLYLTGLWTLPSEDGASFLEIMKNGRGALSVLCSVLAGLVVLALLQAILEKEKSFKETLVELLKFAGRGARGMVGLATIILLALTLGLVTERLGTGSFVAEVASGNMSAALFLPVTFLLSALVSFSTGTSWGTFAIMVPVVLPVASAYGVDQAPFLAAALSGGVFGDHASPISNTTIIASMAAMTDHVDHVRTQLPYAMLAGSLAVTAYAVVGYWFL